MVLKTEESPDKASLKKLESLSKEAWDSRQALRSAIMEEPTSELPPETLSSNISLIVLYIAIGLSSPEANLEANVA